MDILVCFTLLDLMLQNYPMKNKNLKNTSFKTRYENLYKRNNKEIVLKETYRILKIFRNAIIHSVSDIKSSPKKDAHNKKTINEYDISYSTEFEDKKTKKKTITNFSLLLNDSDLEKIFAISYFFITSYNKNYDYDTEVISSYYSDLIKNITIKDEFKLPLKKLSKPLELKTEVRATHGTSSKETNSVLSIELLPLHNDEKKYTGIDYFICHKSCYYLIPEEALDKSGKINISKLQKWELKQREQPFFLFL